MECVSLFVQTSSRPCWLLSPSHWHFFSWVHHLPHANLRLDLLILYQKQHWKDPHSPRPYAISPLSLLNPTSFFYYIPTGVIFIDLNKHLHYPGKSCVWKWLAIHQGTCSWEGHWGGPKHGAAVHAQLPEGVVLCYCASVASSVSCFLVLFPCLLPLRVLSLDVNLYLFFLPPVFHLKFVKFTG